MRKRLITFLKAHPTILSVFWSFLGVILKILSPFFPIRKRILFASFGGRRFDDSPRALYEAICNDSFFDDWELIWCFVNPNDFTLKRGRKVKIDSFLFFVSLLTSNIWISNSGMARGISFHRKRIIEVETWHGTPIKRIGGEEKQNSMISNLEKSKIDKRKIDNRTIRCAQSEFDRGVFQRIFHAAKDSILLCDLPRNDELLHYSNERIKHIKENLHIPSGKRVLLYTPTYREYLIDKSNSTYLAPPITLEKWERMLSDDYVLLIRAHYAITKALNLSESDFFINVSNYPSINDLYSISDVMISDYSSTFIDFSIQNKPMLCFAYDLDEYEQKRGLYFDLEEILPCRIDRTEDELIQDIMNLDFKEASYRTSIFHQSFAPYAGCACDTVLLTIKKRLEKRIHR